MNFNANSSNRQPIGRKVKRVSDVNAVGPTISTPQMQPSYNQPYNQPMSYAANDNNDFNQPPTIYGDYPQQSYSNIPPPAYSQAMANPMQSMQIPPQYNNLISQPVVQDMALQYGQHLADTGKQMMKTEIERYVPVTRLKYYFAVDTRYVLTKLKLLFFPFTHDDWSLKYEQVQDSGAQVSSVPVQPRFEVNAPDLYIPTMAYVTYVLVAGLVLGMQRRFSPEQIGIQASSALAWTIVEIAIYSATLYITNIKTQLRTFDLLAYSGYKYVGIIASVLISLAFGSTGYFSALIYCNIALAFFLMRSLRAQVTTGNSSSGTKRRLYFLLFVAAMQPVLSWWLSFHLTPTLTVVTTTTSQ